MSAHGKPPRVALIAHGCQPNSSSENRTGWEWVVGLSRVGVTTTVFTDSVNRPRITADDVAGSPNLHFVYVEGYSERRSWLPNHLAVTSEYQAFMRNTRPILARMHALDPFDVGHHVSYGNLRLGSPLDAVPDLPVVFGPLGGGQRMPLSVVPFVGRGAAMELLRNLSVVGSPLSRSARLLAKRPSVVLACNRETQSLASSLGFERCELMADFACERNDVPARTYGDDGPLRILWVSRLIPRKGLRLALASFERARAETPMTLTIVGDGPDRTLLREADEAVDFRGMVPPEQLSDLYDSHDVVLFTSMRDSGCSVGLEALARNVPVIAVAHHGAGFVVDHTWGSPVPYAPARTLEARLAERLVEVAVNRSMLESLSAAASRNQTHGTIADRAVQAERLYTELLSR